MHSASGSRRCPDAEDLTADNMKKAYADTQNAPAESRSKRKKISEVSGSAAEQRKTFDSDGSDTEQSTAFDSGGSDTEQSTTFDAGGSDAKQKKTLDEESSDTEQRKASDAVSPDTEGKTFCPVGIYRGESLREIPEEANCVYIVECRDGSYYTGWTNHPLLRLRAHNEGRGAKYTKSRRPVHFIYIETYETKEEAMSREFFIKKMKRAGKERLISEK